MNLREGAGREAGKAEGGAESGPVGGGEDVGVFDDDDGLALTGDAGAEERIQIVDGGEIGRNHGLKRGAAGGERIFTAHFVHGARAEIMQRNDADDCRREGFGNFRIAEVGDVAHAIYFEVVNFRAEGFAYLARFAGKIDEDAAGINDVDREAVRFQPGGDGGEIFLRQAEALAEFLGGEPIVIIGRAGSVQLVNKFGERLLLLRRALQLQEHVVHGRIPGQSAAIIFGDSLPRACCR